MKQSHAKHAAAEEQAAAAPKQVTGKEKELRSSNQGPNGGCWCKRTLDDKTAKRSRCVSGVTLWSALEGEEVPGVVDTVPRQVVARVGATTTTWMESWREP